MNQKPALQALLILVVIVLTGVARAGSAAARDSGPAASGHGSFTFQHETIFFSFHAKEHKNGDDKGRARFDNLTAGTSVAVELTCLSVGGFSASLSGVVTRSDDPALPEGTTVVFGVTDWTGAGAQRPDDITPLFPIPFAQADCDDLVPLTILPVAEGDIIVRP